MGDEREDSANKVDDQETSEAESDERNPGSASAAAPADDDIIIKNQ
jgi:hypothetical protein